MIFYVNLPSGKADLFIVQPLPVSRFANWTPSGLNRHYGYCGKKLYFNQFFAAIRVVRE